MLTGDFTLSLGICLFYELFWLDLFPAGTSIPPNALAPALASLAAAHYLGLTHPAVACMAVILALPLGRVFARIEKYHRQYENDAFNRILKWAKNPLKGAAPFQLTRRSMFILFPVNFVAFALCLSALLVVLSLLTPQFAPVLSQVPLKWPHMWVLGSVGAVLSLRHRPAYGLLFGGVALAVAIRLIG
ncbi:PTS sugar transporter subunit IIC [Fundidesulfovibrio butyratiphilus]